MQEVTSSTLVSSTTFHSTFHLLSHLRFAHKKMSQSVKEQDHKPKNHKDFIFLILILGSITAIGPLTIDMYLPAFLKIGHNFGASENLVQLSLTTCFIGLAVSQLFYGPIIDRFGKKLPLFFGLTIFIIASIACCFANNINQLIILRFFQALGACSAMVIPRSIVRDIFSPQESARVFSHLMLVIGIAPILAPIAGTMLLVHFDWKAIFVFLGSFGIICLLVSCYAIPQSKAPDINDKISSAFKKYRGILHDRNFVVCALSGGLAMAGLFAYITGSPFAYLDFFGLSSKSYSIVFAINSIGFITASQINAYFLKKFSIETILKKVLLVPAIFGIVLILVGANFPTFWLFSLTMFVFLGAIGAIVPSSTALALSNQSKHSGSASALLGTIQFSLATITSFLISKTHDGSLFYMSLIIGTCGVLSFLVYKLFKKT